MSEHAWVLEHIASYAAGGLDAAECERLEQHVAACQPCAQALHEARTLEQQLESLFAEERPEPSLEDRMIQALRAENTRSGLGISIKGWIGISAAAVLVVGVVGAGMGKLIVEGELPFPGNWGANRPMARNDLKQLAIAQPAAHDALFSFPPDDKFVEGFDNSHSTHFVDEFVPAQRSPTSSVKDAEELAQLARSKMLGDQVSDGRKSGVEGRRGSTASQTLGSPPPGLSNKEIGLDPDKPTNYNINRIEEVAVPAPVKPSEAVGIKDAPEAKPQTFPPPLGFGVGSPGTPATGIPLYSFTNDLPTGYKITPYTTTQGKTTSPAAGFYYLPVQQPAVPTPPAPPPVTEPAKPDPAGQGKEDNSPKEKKPESPNALKPNPADAAPLTQRKIIRSGDIEFEVDSFDATVAKITRIAAEEKGYVATLNSDRLPNGKVKGVVIVRVTPDRLDTLILKLRALGELKSQKISSQDITKQYTDLESRLRAARTMEERLLQIIKNGKGEIKDLVQAEKELGVWRTKIEEVEGELRYYANMVSLSTLTITLVEKEIRAPFGITETERVQMGLEVEDVDKAHQQALAAIAEAKGRVTKSELKQHSAGQYSSLVHFEVAPESAGPVRDRLKQLGVVARLEIDRLQTTEGGSGRPLEAKLKRNDTQFMISLYNVANVAPRETTHINLACQDPETVYQKILARVNKAAGRVVTSTLNRQRNEQTTGTIQFEVKTAEADAVLQDLKSDGEVMSLQVTENPDTQNVTRSKRGFLVKLFALGQVEPREKATIQLAAKNVPAGYQTLREAVLRAKGRILNAQLNEQDKQHITAKLDFDVRRADEAAITTAMTSLGVIYSRKMVRAQDSERVTDSKVGMQVELIDLTCIPARETYTFGIEVQDVDQTTALLTALVAENKGRTVEAHQAHERTGRVTAKLIYDVPLAAASGLVEKLKGTGTIRVLQNSRNPQVPEGELAMARLDVTLSNTEGIVRGDEGWWPRIREGLRNSFVAISWSLTWVIFGVCVLLPWALVIYGIVRLVQRARRKASLATPAS